MINIHSNFRNNSENGFGDNIPEDSSVVLEECPDEDELYDDADEFPDDDELYDDADEFPDEDELYDDADEFPDDDELYDEADEFSYDDEQRYGKDFAFLNCDELYDEDDDFPADDDISTETLTTFSYEKESEDKKMNHSDTVMRKVDFVNKQESEEFEDELRGSTLREELNPYEETEKYFNGANFMISKEPFYISQEGFYNDTKRKIFHIIMNYRMKHCALQECYFVIKELKDTDVIALYGHFHKTLPDKVVSWFDEDFRAVRFDDYFADQRKLRKSKNRKNNDEKKEDSSVIETKISEWLVRTPYAVFEETICSRVQGQEGVKYLLAMIYTYMKNISKGCKNNDNNVLMTAPSGCGKTETYRALRDYFAEEIPELPIDQVDMTSITEEGYRGKDTNDIVRKLFIESQTNGVGLIFMDEFDKKLLPSYTSQNVNVNAAVQAQILTLIEGRVVSKDDTYIDTSRTFFVGMGSFDQCRKNRRQVKRGIGYGAQETKQKEHYDVITRKDMIELGASYELIGRFSTIINFHPLPKKIVNRIIDGFLQKKAEYLDCNIKITKKFREHMHDASNSEYGCRNLKSIIDEAVMPATCILNRIEGDKEILITLDYKNDRSYCHVKELATPKEAAH